MPKTTCILGAGFSHVCGLPLARDLFDTQVRVYSEKQNRRFSIIQDEYNIWRKENPDKHLEMFIAELYSGLFKYYAKFEYAVELIAAVLATPVGHEVNYSSARYKYRLTSPSNCSIHKMFWQEIISHFKEISIITTNYDILIEKTLRHKKMDRVFGFGFHYGGFKTPQRLKGSAQPFTIRNQQKEIELNNGIPIYKLHGSLNWSRKSENEIQMFLDMRPAFRNNCDAAIIPPLPEKSVPNWLANVWREAEKILTESQNWIICGYSFPDYDEAINQMIGRSGYNKNIFIIDPDSKKIASKLNSLLPKCNIYSLSGLPSGLNELLKVFKKSLLNK